MMLHRLRLPRTLLLLALGCKSPEEAKDSGPTYAREFSIVHVRAADNVATQLAVHACAGIENRRLGGSIFVQTDVDVPQASIDGALVQDELWLPELGLAAAAEMESGPFLQSCLEKAGGCLRYSYASQQEILPAILTVAAAKGLPPLADEGGLTCKNPKVDALSLFAGKDSQLLSTQVAMEEVLSSTSGLAMLNPGYDRNAEDPADPEIIDDMPVALIDFVFSRKLFVTFLVNGCIEENPERELLSRIVNESGWPTPVGVFGYNDSWLVGGYLYEAQTRCLESANMGAIPTRTTNLSFFDTRRPAIQTPEELSLTAPEDVNYDPSKTYVAFVIGDGDNIRYIMSTRKDWLQQRLERCGSGGCPPLSWTISPHLSDMAPDVLEWYAKSAHATGSDYFILPPSGYQYAYPGRMPADVQARFVTGTEKAAKILGTHSTVHWEWLDGWDAAVQGFLPRYARQGGQIHGVFPVNVPYLIEAFPSWPAEQTYAILPGSDGGKVVLFRSQSWRGVDGRDDFHPTPQQLADRLAALPTGTVTWVYMTSDGGLTLENSYFELIGLLAP
ncbi:MAG TPA: hypothetical protein PLA94_09815, partial [Myxococcota bacterium]|nr:hypothetical protein [Myxococcota bacterium]